MVNSILRAENKYLTLLVVGVVTVLIAVLGFIGNIQVNATKTNTAEVKLLRGDINDMNVITNDRINQITNRLDVGQERSISAYKLLQHSIRLNTESIVEIKNDHRSGG